MKKIKAIVAMMLSLALVFSLVACGGGSSSTDTSPAAGGSNTSSSDPILIGHEVALTGGSALWGESEKNALEMEIEKINAKGGVMGRQLKLVSYDTKADQTEGINVANRLIGDHVVGIIGPAQSGVYLAAASVTEPAKMIMIGTTTTNVKVTVDDEGKVKPYNFRTAFIDPYQGKVAAEFALNDLNVKKAAIFIDVGSDYSQGLSEFFIDTFSAGGGQIVAEEAFRSEELDYRSQLGKIKDSGAELVFMPTMQKEAGLAMKQARELGLTCFFLGGDAWASEELISLGGAATEGCFYVNIASIEDPSISAWVEEYRTKWGKDPVMPNPVLAVDALLMLVDAMEKTQSTDSTVLAEYMGNMKDVQVLSGKMTIDPATHNPLNKPAVIETVKDGKFAFYKSVAAE